MKTARDCERRKRKYGIMRIGLASRGEGDDAKMPEQIVELLKEKKYLEVKEILSEMFVPDIAELLDELDTADIVMVFRLLRKDIGSDVFSYMSPDNQERLIGSITDREISRIINEMYIDDVVDIVDEMPANVVKRILKNTPPETRAIINKILKYDEDTAGYCMNTAFIDLKSDMTVADSLKRIRRLAGDVETINTLYVTTSERALIGVLTIRDLLLADADELISDIMTTRLISAGTSCDQEEMALMFKKYDLLSMPVVDKENRLVGIVTIDDVVDIISEETTEDIEKMHAIMPNDREYLKTSVFRIWLNRIPWLMILMISATFTGLIITRNEMTLNKGAYGLILTACIPMLMDTAGNAGGQASATVIRGIALHEIDLRDYFKVVWKELAVSMLIGLSLAIVCFLKLLFIDGLHKVPNGYSVAGIVTFSMFLTILVSKFVGASLPLIAKQCRLDPAVMASPFITTVIDTLSLLILCGLANSLLPA